VSDPLAGFLEGLVGEPGGAGFRGGYDFREGIKDRRRRRYIEEAILRMKMASAERENREGELRDAMLRDETGLGVVPSRAARLEFTPPPFGAPAPVAGDRVRDLRRAVGTQLVNDAVPAGVQGSFGAPPLEAPQLRQGIRFGGVEQVGTSRAVREEIGYDPQESTGSLEGDISRSRQPTTAQLVGQTLAGLAGRDDLSPVQQSLVGRGAVPFSALQPKRYAPTTREEWLRDQRDVAALRVGSRATKEDLTAVERQIDDTRADLAAAERRRPKKPLVFVRPEDEQAFGTAETEAGEAVDALQQRLDSLNVVRDELAAELQGGPGGGRPPVEGTDPRLQQLDQQYQAALSRGVDPVAAKAVYDRERQRITAKRGRP